MNTYLRSALLLCLASIALPAVAKETPGDDYDVQYIGPQASAKFIPFSGLDGRRWPGDTVYWWYNPQGALFATDQVVATINAAAAAWARISSVHFVYLGTTTQALSNVPDDRVVIGWLDPATFASRFGNYGAFTTLWWNGAAVVDGEMSINTALSINLSDLQGIVTHELGHLIGLDHSDAAASIMYARPYHAYRYMQFPREDDVSAAQSLYPAALACEATNAGAVTGALDVHLPVIRDAAGQVWWADLRQQQGEEFYVADYGIYGAPPFHGLTCAADATLLADGSVHAPLLNYGNGGVWASLAPAPIRSDGIFYRVTGYGAR